MGKSKKTESDGKKSAAQSAKGPTGSDAEPSISFEGALEQLETTVGRLEQGEMPLEEALELFEKGVALSRQCATTLDAAEKRVEILMASRAKSEDWRTEVFDSEPLEDDPEDPLDDEIDETDEADE